MGIDDSRQIDIPRCDLLLQYRNNPNDLSAKVSPLLTGIGRTRLDSQDQL